MDYELMTMWLGVDPLMDKYPSISSYAYCAWNPIKLTDSDGQFPRLPYYFRVLTSKHVYSAIVYKMRNGGDLEIWENPSGCIFASVQATNGGVDELGATVIKAKMFRPKGYSSEVQIKTTTDVLVNTEKWMDELATGIVDFCLKAAANMGYSLINEPTKLLTGYSLAGTESNFTEKAEAFVGTVAGLMGFTLSKGMGTIKTVGKPGLGKYNDFVHKTGGFHGKTKKEMGRLYKNNEELNSAISTYNNHRRVIDGVSALRKDD